jgi:hypothetical protein
MSASGTSQTLPINPVTVPQRELYTGAKMPAVGLGTFGSDHVTADQVAEAVTGAAARQDPESGVAWLQRNAQLEAGRWCIESRDAC